MSEKYFLQKCIISAEDAKGSYAMMSNLDVDPLTKQMYDSMVADTQKNISLLNERLNYLKQFGRSGS